ncbi:MAG: general secretion pathway protein GspB [Thermodesulfobacteriota bacterium]
MSYILDALRRLEQDKELAKRGASPMEAVFVPDIERVEAPERMRLRWVGAGVVLLVAVVALTYWITRHTLVPPTEHAPEGTAPQLSSVQPRYDPPPPAPSREVASSSFQPRPSARERTAPSPTLRKPAEVANPSPPIRAEAGSQPVVSTGEDALAGRQESAAMSREVSEAEVIQEWKGSDVKINAIAYSRDEKGRFAVVNLKTVHKGDRVEGLAVVEIQEDGIVFEKGGTKYRVSLGKR